MQSSAENDFGRAAAMTSRWLTSNALLAAVTWGWCAVASANGALPATVQVLLPAAAPKTLIVATTFGLVISDDDGVTWRWICEHDGGNAGNAYQLTAGPRERILTLGNDGLVFTEDRACRWQPLVDQSAASFFDYFPDPVDPDRVLLLGTLLDGASFPSALVEAKLGDPATGRTSTRVLYAAQGGEKLRTVEIARSDPRLVYASLYTPEGTAPARLLRSDDGGAHFTALTPAPADPAPLGIIAIDPVDPQTLFLRMMAPEGDRLVISRDGGKTVQTALAAGRVLSAFVRLGNGHLLVGWLDLDKGFIYRSIDGGATFAPLATTLHPNGFAQRDGRAYAVLDAVADRHALAVSDDEGTTWKRVMAFNEVTAIASCPNAPAVCAASCQDLVSRQIFLAALCSGQAVPDPAEDAGAAHDAADGPSSEDTEGTAAGARSPDRGCSCRLGGAGRPDLADAGPGKNPPRSGRPVALLLAAAWAAAAARPFRRRWRH